MHARGGVGGGFGAWKEGNRLGICSWNKYTFLHRDYEMVSFCMHQPIIIIHPDWASFHKQFQRHGSASESI